MSKNLVISVITATWNCETTLKDCLVSINKQTYPHIEHIIIDGASTDNTVSIIKNHTNQIAGFISEPDKGIYDALNKGIKKSTGDVIGFLHADDIYASDTTLEQIAAAFEDSTVCAVYGDLVYVKQSDTSTVVRYWKSKSFTKHDLQLGWMPPHPTLYVRREWYTQIGNFNCNYKISADYLSIISLFSKSEFKTEYIPKTLIRMRLGGVSNKSLSSLVNKSKEDWKAMRACNFSAVESAVALIWKNISKISQITKFRKIKSQNQKTD